MEDNNIDNMIANLQAMLKNKDSNDINNLINQLSSNMNNNSSNSATLSSNLESNNSNDNDNTRKNDNNFNFDIETIMMIKKMMDALNSPVNDSRANLLYSLKPYMHGDKNKKIDQYIQFLKLEQVLKLFSSNGGDINNGSF